MRKVNRDTRGDHQKVTNSQGSKESRHPTPTGDGKPSSLEWGAVETWRGLSRQEGGTSEAATCKCW